MHDVMNYTNCISLKELSKESDPFPIQLSRHQGKDSLLCLQPSPPRLWLHHKWHCGFFPRRKGHSSLKGRSPCILLQAVKSVRIVSIWDSAACLAVFKSCVSLDSLNNIIIKTCQNREGGERNISFNDSTESSSYGKTAAHVNWIEVWILNVFFTRC